MTENQIFTFRGQDLHVLTIDNEPWFIALDIARILGTQNSSHIAGKADAENKALHEVKGSSRRMLSVNTAGLLQIVSRSESPRAVPLRRFVKREILPLFNHTLSSPVKKKVKSETQTFQNDLFKIAVKSENGETLFEAESVARALGFEKTETTRSGRTTKNIRWARVNDYLNLSGEIKSGSFISEPMVYKLAFKASNAFAEQFTDWLAVEVLPSIRKNGTYMTPQTIEQVLSSPDFLVGLVNKLKKDQVELKNERKKRMIAEKKLEKLKSFLD